MTKNHKNQKTSLKNSKPWFGILPYIGVILFLLSLVPMLLNGFSGGWQKQVLQNAIVYMIGWAGVGAGISHLFFGKATSKSIGFEKSPYELEVGFADLSFGVVALLAPQFSPDYWLAIILVSSLYRIGCGFGHVKQIFKDKNFAINNTAILINDFFVPAFLLFAYYSWA